MTTTAKTVRPFVSGFCTPGNPADSHARCPQTFTFSTTPCACACHTTPPEKEDPVPLPEESGLAWEGQTVDKIRDRWVVEDRFAADCGEHRVLPGRDHAILEALRFARSDVAYLLRVIEQQRRAL